MGNMPVQDRSAEGLVTMRDWERRKEFAGFTEEDARLLREFRPTAETHIDDIVDELYRRFLAFEETRAFFPDDSTIARVKVLQREYFLGLTQGDYGETYLTNRLNIGRIHQQIGLSPRWYMGAYTIYWQLMLPPIVAAFKANQEQMQLLLLAMMKIMKLDEELAVTTYIAAAESVITQQAREIVELSTPVIQVWAGVVVTPLIGTLDTMRTQQLMEQLLHHIVESQSSIALIDITGVPTIDTRTAQHLIETIAAVRLLGAQAVLTGVRPAIAQTLVHLGIDLSHVATRSSLAAGLRFAMDALDLQVTSKEGRPS